MENGKIFSGNILKILGCIFMFIDHLGAIMFPEVIALRIIGRLAYPIFAFTLAEGCFHTRNRLKHFLLIFGSAVIIQVVYYFAMKSFSLSIFMIFSISIVLIYLYDYIHKYSVDILECEEKCNKKFALWILFIFLFFLLIVGTIILDNITPYLKDGYGYQGVLIPVIIYIVMKLSNRNLLITLIVLAIVLAISALMRKEFYNFYSIISVVILFFYNGTRGKYNLKYFFYIFYPAHIALIYLVNILINN